MHSLVSLNGSLISSTDSFSRNCTNAFLYGKGVFTTLAYYRSAPFQFARHWERLAANAATIGVDISQYTEQDAERMLRNLITANSGLNGRVRMTFVDESPGEIWACEGRTKTGLLIASAGLRVISANFGLTLSPYAINTRSPLTGVKSCNYLEPLIAFREAKDRGFEEAVRLNERGEVASVCMANVFWLKGGRLFTPSLQTGCLAGTTRGYILENLDCEEVETGLEMVRGADEIFLTSAGIGVVQASELDGRKMTRRDHPIIHLVPRPA